MPDRRRTLNFHAEAGNPSDEERPMRKLKLGLDALRVESYVTSAETDDRGTVQANDSPSGNPFGCSNLPTCPFTPGTCYNSCQGTCDDSCLASCYESCQGTCYLSCPDTCA
jgi:hypothetical protein